MIVWFSAILVVVVSAVVRRRRKPRLPYPPGLPGLPLIGNALDMPTSDFGRAFHALAARYGGLASLRILGRTIIVVDSYDTACELLDKRSRNYSGRHDSVMANLSSLSEFSVSFIPYGPKWRQHRRIYYQTLSLSAIHTRYRPRMRQATQGLLLNLLDSPGSFWRHISHAFVASVLTVRYGIKIPHDDDEYGKMLLYTLSVIEALLLPGRYLVELFPALQCLPVWLPGTRFKKDARIVRERTMYASRVLYEEGRKVLGTENAGDSMLAMMLQRVAALGGDAAKDEEEQSMGALITAFIGKSVVLYPLQLARGADTIYGTAGSDTTVAALQAFFLAMAMYPDVQRKAQEELDKVIGRTRLPDFDDRGSLPYISALVTELTRWNAVVPMGLPHASLEDDECDGYLIPKGSIVMANIWAFSSDPAVYPDPDTFDPERFLKDGKAYSGARDPYAYMFGFGRRICPGRHLADASLFLACASVLHAFAVSPPLDGDGQSVKLEARIDTDGVVAHPEKFDCVIEPRWAGAANLIRA